MIIEQDNGNETATVVQTTNSSNVVKTSTPIRSRKQEIVKDESIAEAEVVTEVTESAPSKKRRTESESSSNANNISSRPTRASGRNKQEVITSEAESEGNDAAGDEANHGTKRTRNASKGSKDDEADEASTRKSSRISKK